MSALSSVSASAPPAGQLVLRGRIRTVRSFTGRDGVISHFTLLTLAAADEYSLPAVLEISSTRPLGKPGDDISQRVQLSGIPRTATSKPDSRGQVTQWETATNLLRAVEA